MKSDGGVIFRGNTIHASQFFPKDKYSSEPDKMSTRVTRWSSKDWNCKYRPLSIVLQWMLGIISVNRGDQAIQIKAFQCKGRRFDVFHNRSSSLFDSRMLAGHGCLSKKDVHWHCIHRGNKKNCEEIIHLPSGKNLESLRFRQYLLSQWSI